MNEASEEGRSTKGLVTAPFFCTEKVITTCCEDVEAVERPHMISCEVPASGMDSRPCLLAVFDARRPVDDRRRQILRSASHVAGLLLEMERANGRWPLSSSRGQSDGAAPLIGSSLSIRAVRDRIEGVAGTDFTVLIEGESGTQPHLGFVEVSGEAAVG